MSEVVVREVACKSILNATGIGDYSLNCYTGCEHGCIYCYARYMQRFHPHAEPWGRFVDVKVNAVEVLKKQLRRAKPGSVFMSSACDGWQPVEGRCKLTRRCCELLCERGFDVHVLTKSALVLRDFDVLTRDNARIGVTVTTLDERLRKLWEPGCSTVEARFEVIRKARDAGYRTAIMFGPLLPWLSDDERSLTEMFARAADLEIGTIWVDALNPRPRVWPAVAELLRREFPDLRERYSRMLFDKSSRAEYLGSLNNRLNEAAKRAGISGRIHGIG